VLYLMFQLEKYVKTVTFKSLKTPTTGDDYLNNNITTRSNAQYSQDLLCILMQRCPNVKKVLLPVQFSFLLKQEWIYFSTVLMSSRSWKLHSLSLNYRDCYLPGLKGCFSMMKYYFNCAYYLQSRGECLVDGRGGAIC
jgi:hypothetical protein